MEKKNVSLTKRENQVLNALVRAHVDSGLPVGSVTLSDEYDLGVSSATIRATLASLEEKGCLQQPHTSAGRIPTECGYRQYVLQCMEGESKNTELSGHEFNSQLELQVCEGDLHAILSQIAQAIGDMSNQLGLVLPPRFDQALLTRVELVTLSQERILLVVSLNSGLVKSLIVECQARFSKNELQAVNRILNERLVGLTLEDISDTVRERMQPLLDRNRVLLRSVVEEMETINRSSEIELHVAGVRNLCLQPEFEESLQVAGLLDLAEKKDLLAQLMQDRRGVVVTIGEEHHLTPLQRCGMVTASYEVDGDIGVIGILGPTRMPYYSLMGLVKHAARRASQLAC